MIFESLLMILALYKSFVIWREHSGIGTSILIKILVRDQAVYFLACVTVIVLYS